MFIIHSLSKPMLRQITLSGIQHKPEKEQFKLDDNEDEVVGSFNKV